MTTSTCQCAETASAGETPLRARSPRATRQAEELRRTIEVAAREWRCTVDALDSPVLVVEGDGRVVRLNRAASTLLGRGFADAIGAALPELSGEEPWKTAAEAVNRSLARRVGGRRQCRDEAGRTWELVTTVPRRPAAESVVLVLHDLTEREALEARLRRTEVMSALGSLVAGVAHEARNPLFGISAALDALVARVGNDPRITPFVGVLQGEVARLTDLVHDLFEYGKAPTGASEPGDVGDVVEEAVRATADLAEGQGVGLRLSVDRPLPRVMVNRVRLAYVVKNLLQNAVQHSATGGLVEVLVGRSPRAPAGLACLVRDRGSGIAPDDLPRIFEPFFSRRRGGFGLGLAVAHRIVEEHRGTLQARNRAGGGAELEVWLPALEPLAAPGGVA